MTGFLFRIPRSAVRRITGAALFALVVLFALAASGCGGYHDKTAIDACVDAGGIPILSHCGVDYAGCQLPCPPTATRIHSDYRPPVEAPEVTP